MTLADPIITGIFALFGAGVGAFFTKRRETYKAVVHAELEIAKFRQAWINSLREQFSEFHSLAMLPEYDPSMDQDFYKSGTQIELHLNPRDPDYKELQKVMYSMLETSKSSVAEKYLNNPEFVDVTQRILKREWDRIKRDIRYHYK